MEPDETVSRSDVCVAVTSLGLLTSSLIALLTLHLFPTTIQPFDLEDTALHYPHLPSQINGMGNLFGNAIISILVMGVWIALEYRAGKITYFHLKRKLFLSLFCIIQGVILVNLITHITKQYVGGLRPNFLAVCQVNETMVDELRRNGTTWVGKEMSRTICTSEEPLSYRWSFPSGHSSNAYYGMVLSILLLNSYDTYGRKYPFLIPVKATLQFLFLTFATLIACSRLTDYHHHWYDVIAGSVLGCVLAVATHYWFLLPIMKWKIPFTPTSLIPCNIEEDTKSLPPRHGCLQQEMEEIVQTPDCDDSEAGDN